MSLKREMRDVFELLSQKGLNDLNAFLNNRPLFLENVRVPDDEGGMVRLTNEARFNISFDVNRLNHHFFTRGSEGEQAIQSNRRQTVDSEVREIVLPEQAVTAKHADGSPFCNRVTFSGYIREKNGVKSLRLDTETGINQPCLESTSLAATHQPPTITPDTGIVYTFTLVREDEQRALVAFMDDGVLLGPHLEVAAEHKRDATKSRNVYLSGFIDSKRSCLSFNLLDYPPVLVEPT